jgi:hypothetical protein
MSEDTDIEQLALAHRQSGTMLIFTLALIGFLVYATLGSMLGLIALFLVFLPIPFCVMIVRGYFQRESWALPWVSVIWIIAIVMCFLLAFVEFSKPLHVEGSTWGLIQGMLLLYLCWSMFQRLKLLRHPMFRSWYSGDGPVFNQNTVLQDGEVLATCPHCHSLLAVQPLNISADEKCPMCNMNLVSNRSVELYSEIPTNTEEE